MGTKMSDWRGDLERGFREHERLLWGLSYRMTGSAADADEIVQDTFVRALDHPAADGVRALRPWLVRIATNLAIDVLRQRRRRPYVGPWLPEPIETPADLDDVPGARYERVESAGFAFLRALEALPPKQRAVLLLRDVLDYSVRETAEALGLSDNHAKVLHHRARRTMAAYDEEREVPTEAVRARTQRALERFLQALLARDVSALEQVMAEDVEMWNDAGGVYRAARKPVIGRERVVRFHVRIARLYPNAVSTARVELRLVNGMPAVVMDLGEAPAGSAPRQVITVRTDAEGRIRRIEAVLAPDKIARLFTPSAVA